MTQTSSSGISWQNDDLSLRDEVAAFHGHTFPVAHILLTVFFVLGAAATYSAVALTAGPFFSPEEELERIVATVLRVERDIHPEASVICVGVYRRDPNIRRMERLRALSNENLLSLKDCDGYGEVPPEGSLKVDVGNIAWTKSNRVRLKVFVDDHPEWMGLENRGKGWELLAEP